MKKTSRRNRDLRIYRDYFGLNEEQHKVPVPVLARRYSLTRGRIYQIIDAQVAKQERHNERIQNRKHNSEADAEEVAKRLAGLLGL